MADLQRRLEEDKAMRDAARRLIEADLGLVRGDAHDRGLAKRAADGVSETSATLADQALGYAKAHPLVVGGGIFALALVLFRNPILDMVIDLLEDDDEPAPPPAAEPSSPPQPEPAEPEKRSWRKWNPFSGERE